MRWALAGASALWLAGAAGAAGAPAVARAGFDAASARAAAVKPAVPELAQLPARALLLIREDTGAVVLSQNASAELAIASTTKLMTAYVTLQHEPLSARLAVDPYAAGPGESLAPVPVGTRLSVPDMLRAMLLPSGNNIAYSLALDVGGTVAHFVSMMNAAAAKLNMGRTHYTTPIGLDTPGDNYSTARDLAILARVVMRDALIREIVDERSATLSDGVTVINRNDLVGAYPWVVGVKTGSTFDAAECLVGAARLGGVRLISVVLGAPSIPARDADTLALLRYGLSLFRSARIAVAGETYATVPIRGRSRAVALIAAESATLVLARTSVLHAALEVPRRLSGPIAAGTREGSIEVSEDGRPVESVALVTATAVPAPPPSPPKIVSRAASGQRLVWIAGGGGLSATLVGCSLLLMRRRIARGAVGTAR
jgi:D-alanyl-D-alanine carboxypeptidase (penicillin-binding protein 5/6)